MHYLKIDPQYFSEVWNGNKTFEVRKNDRGFEKGDRVKLEEFDRNKNEYTGRAISTKITYILEDKEYCKEGFIIFGFKILYGSDKNLENYI